MTVGKILSDAADLIEERGWCQGVFENEDGCLCILGAIVAVPADTDLAIKAQRHVGKFLGVNGLSSWNDAPERTQAEVVAALRVASKQRK